MTPIPYDTAEASKRDDPLAALQMVALSDVQSAAARDFLLQRPSVISGWRGWDLARRAALLEAFQAEGQPT